MPIQTETEHPFCCVPVASPSLGKRDRRRYTAERVFLFAIVINVYCSQCIPLRALPIFYEFGDTWTCPGCGQLFIACQAGIDNGSEYSTKLLWITQAELESDIADVASFLGMAKQEATP